MGGGGRISAPVTLEIRIWQKIQRDQESSSRGGVRPWRSPRGPRARAGWARPPTTRPSPRALPTASPGPRALTFDEEEEAHDAHGGHDGPRHDEGQAPARGCPVAGDQGPQDVSHGGVRIPDPHNQAAPAARDTRQPMTWRGLSGGSCGARQHVGRAARGGRGPGRAAAGRGPRDGTRTRAPGPHCPPQCDAGV